MFEGSYPPGVTGKMIDHYAGEDYVCRCENCFHYDGGYCTKDWNNMDDDYMIPERDEKDPDDYCDDYVAWEEEGE